MNLHQERVLEDTVCRHLDRNGWLYSSNDEGYDAPSAVFAEDLLGWLWDSQAAEVQRLVDAEAARNAASGVDPVRDRRAVETVVMAAVVKSLKVDGTLRTLRGSVAVHVGRAWASLKICQFAPAADPNGTLAERARLVRVRVMRQVRYSTRSQRSLDMVLLVNGIPVATVELKSDYTQSVQAAIEQYRKDRDPGRGSSAEPLLQPGRGALVHFAVSNSEVHMTTRLAGKDTVFLPFNKGHKGGAGNPPNPHGIATSYLWEEVWEREAWLRLLGEFVYIPQKKAGVPVPGNAEPVVFPRFHQWDVVRRIIADTSSGLKRVDAALRFLVQHSAGSGKTNEVSWTAHALSRLRDSAGDRVFSTVLVVTDRVILDKQLQEALRQLDGSKAKVASITDAEAARKGYGSKSAYLAGVLESGAPAIAVTTLQTFPHALAKMKVLTGKRFAIIVDEAHQSQDGSAAEQMTKGLGSAAGASGGRDTDAEATEREADAAAEDTDLDQDTLLERELATAGAPANVTMVAFTATPRASTLHLFGTPRAGGVEPFHVYPMKQAIEEGFILDVLRFYRAPKLSATVGMEGSARAAQQLVDAKSAKHQIARRVFEDPTVIAEKARFILDHFHANVQDSLDGTGKAMVVMGSRLAAVRMQAELIRQTASRSGPERVPGVLVAFSGDISDGGQHVSEAQLNSRRRGHSTQSGGARTSDPASLFKSPAERILVVANKYQTGFDQPLLCAMYLDKPLKGINAVQTLSRLNRVAHDVGKEDVFIVDFTNSRDEIVSAFRTYYQDASLPEDIDAASLVSLGDALDEYGLYVDADLAAVTVAALREDLPALDAAISPVWDAYRDLAARGVEGDEEARRAAATFKVNASRYVDGYTFLSHMMRMAESPNSMHMMQRTMTLRLLLKRIKTNTPSSTTRLDLRALTVNLHGIADAGPKSISIHDGSTSLQGNSFDPIAHTPELELTPLQVVLNDFNARFADLNVGVPAEVVTDWVLGAADDIVTHDKPLVDRARAVRDASKLASTTALGDALFNRLAYDTEQMKALHDAYNDHESLRDAVAAVAAQLLCSALGLQETEHRGRHRGAAAVEAHA